MTVSSQNAPWSWFSTAVGRPRRVERWVVESLIVGVGLA